MNNPVAWQNWGPEALELAKKSNRLIFISIGYAACHWCHVMERESFENAEVAALLNSSFIPIKIDREERPDVDRIYMNYVQATSGSGGWPLNVFITPDLEPIFGGTYWPGPGSTMAMGNHVGFVGILEKIRDLWKYQQQRCLDSAKDVTLQLREFAEDGSISRKEGADSDGLDLELLDEAYEHFAAKYDSTYAGFGGAPKFPTPTNLSFLLRLSQYPSAVTEVLGAKDCTTAKDMVLATLSAEYMIKSAMDLHVTPLRETGAYRTSKRCESILLLPLWGTRSVEKASHRAGLGAIACEAPFGLALPETLLPIISRVRCVMYPEHMGY
jgi:uncharacterized protein YyaL (SSP411 family)